MRKYYRRFWRRFRDDLKAATGEQVVGALLAVAILICQLHFGVIKPGEFRANFLSIAWPYAALVFFLVVRHMIAVPHKLDEECQRQVDELSTELQSTQKEIQRLNTKPDIGGEIIAVFWEPFQDPYSTAENIHSRYYVKLRLVNRNDVPCTVDEYRILVNSIYGDRPCQGRGSPSGIGKLRHPTSAYRDEFTFTELTDSQRAALTLYKNSPPPPRSVSPDTWTQTMPLDIPRHLPLERARKAEGWVTFEVGNYIPSPIQPKDILTREYMAVAPWQQDIVVIVVDSLSKGEHSIYGQWVDVAPAIFSVD
ncbi:MAG: hypothetical protein WCC25_09115 [Candidatus Korobacteraceae bacterium]